MWLKAKHLKMKIIVLISFSHHNNIKRWSLDKNKNMLILFFGQWAKFFWFLEMFMPWWFYLLYIAWSMQKGNLRFGYVIVIQMPFSASLLFIFPKNKLKIFHWLLALRYFEDKKLCVVTQLIRINFILSIP